MPGAYPSDGKVDIVFVGEAPGFVEGQSGVPFSGPSGRLLDLVLDQHGIDRGSVGVTNACLCRPKDNRTPTPSEVKCCWPRLKAEIDQHSPSTIVALGNTATQVILESKVGITKARIGKPKTSRVFPNADIIPTYHPAACLRSGDFFPYLLRDVGKINGTETEYWIEPTWIEVDDRATALQAIKELDAFEEIVVDIEVGIDRDTFFGHAERYQRLCIGVAYDPVKAVVFGENAVLDDFVYHRLLDLFRRKKLANQNVKFDDAGMGGGFPWVFDTMLASYVLDERPGTNSLDYNATEELGAPPWKHEIEKYKDKDESYAVIPRDVLYKYNAFDCCATFQLMRRQERQLEAAGLRHVHDRLLWYTPLITHMETRGLGVDMEYHRELMRTYLEKIEAHDEGLAKWVKNPRSWKQVKEALQELGVKRVDSTDVDHLATFLEVAYKQHNDELVEFIQKMFTQRKEAKLYGTYIKGLGKHIYQGRIHGSLNLHGSVTGRLTGKRPSLLNIPRGNIIKAQFIPDRSGDVFVQCDIRAAELRVMAVEAQDPYLLGVLTDESRDIHGEVAERFFGPDWTYEQRVRAKAVVYGLGYGREAYSIAMEFGISEAEAKRYLSTFFEAIPNVVEWKQRIKQTIFEKGDDLVTHFGRHRRFYLITKDNMKDVEKEAYAFIPQSTANDINLHAAAVLDYDHSVDIRLTVHDSILAQCKPDEAPDVARLMQDTVARVAREQYSDFVPFTTDVAIGPNWGAV